MGVAERTGEALPERWSARAKTEIVLRLLKGEEIGTVLRETQVPVSPCGWVRPTTWVWIPSPATRTHRATSAGSTRSSRRRPGRALLLGRGAGVRRLDVAPAHGARGGAYAMLVGQLPRVGVHGVFLDLGGGSACPTNPVC